MLDEVVVYQAVVSVGGNGPMNGVGDDDGWIGMLTIALLGVIVVVVVVVWCGGSPVGKGGGGVSSGG